MVVSLGFSSLFDPVLLLPAIFQIIQSIRMGMWEAAVPPQLGIPASSFSRRRNPCRHLPSNSSVMYCNPAPSVRGGPTRRSSSVPYCDPQSVIPSVGTSSVSLPFLFIPYYVENNFLLFLLCEWKGLMYPGNWSAQIVDASHKLEQKKNSESCTTWQCLVILLIYLLDYEYDATAFLTTATAYCTH